MIFRLILYIGYLFLEVNAGVSGLTKFMRSKYHSSWRNVKNDHLEEVDHLCIDMNQILHTSTRCGGDDRSITSKLYSEIDKILKLTRPRKSIVLAFDGPAPFAKLSTQRKRRITAPENSEITPGTRFMGKIETLMICYILQRHKRPELQNVSLYISDPTIPGEGELKAIDWIRTCVSNISESIVLFGSDSDIILQALTLTEYPNISVLQCSREYLEAFCNTTELLSQFQRSLNPALSNPSQCDDSYHEISSPDCYDVHTHSQASITQTNLALDLVVLFAMQGNDYLPRLRGITIENALYAYAKVLQSSPGEVGGLVQIVEYDGIPSSNSTSCLGPNTTPVKQTVRLNKHFLRAFMMTLTENMLNKVVVTSLPIHIPSHHSTLHEILQKMYNKSVVVREDFETEVCDDGRNQTSWTSRISAGSFYWSSPVTAIYASMKESREALAESVLKQYFPDHYKRMLQQQIYARKTLQSIRELVIREKAQRAAEPVSNIDKEYRSGSEICPGDGNETSSADDSGQWEENENLEGDGNMISMKAYSKYVRDSDVETYLRGLAWVAHMYQTGRCPDVGYSFIGRQSPSPLRVVDYLDRRELDEALGRRLSSDINYVHYLSSPYTQSRYLSASATAACIIPIHETSSIVMPGPLRDAWREIQMIPLLQSLGSPLSDEGNLQGAVTDLPRPPTSPGLSLYDRLSAELEKVWTRYSVSANIVPPDESRNTRAPSEMVASTARAELADGFGPLWSASSSLGTWTVITSLSDSQLRHTWPHSRSPEGVGRSTEGDGTGRDSVAMRDVYSRRLVRWAHKDVEFPLTAVPARMFCPRKLPSHLRILRLETE